MVIMASITILVHYDNPYDNSVIRYVNSDIYH